MSGRTRSKTVRFEATPTVEISATPEEPPPPSPAESDQRLEHSAGLLSMMGKSAILSMLATRGAVNGGRRGEPPPVGGRESPVEDREEIPWAMAAMLATREDLDATLDDQRPPYKPPDLPHCYASDLKVPKSHGEAMRSEHAHLWKDSAGREFYGLLEAGTFEPV